MNYGKHNMMTDKLKAAIIPILSLINKSKKSLAKLTPGSWQHAMLSNNLKALQIAYSLMNQNGNTINFTKVELNRSIILINTMITKSKKAQKKFASGSSQYTLLRNRIRALLTARMYIQKEIQ
jgi:hypothetical protein